MAFRRRLNDSGKRESVTVVKPLAVALAPRRTDVLLTL
jgi:hypothetical protein